MALRVAVINGPNLNMLGLREPGIYGTETLGQLEDRTVGWGRRLGVDVTPFQSNHEGAIIDRIHACRTDADAIVINPGAYTHTSYAIYDALLAVALPAVEVHLSNIHAREPWRSVSLIAPAVVRSIFGRGTVGYEDALRLLVNRSTSPWETVAYGDHPEQVMDVRNLSPPPPGEGRLQNGAEPDTALHKGDNTPSREGSRPAGNSTAPDPRTGPPRVAVFLHGGFWRREWGRDTIDTLAADLAARGWVTANVEYRRLGCDGGWPATGDDVAAAVRRVIDLTGADRLTIVGHSAGGQLALVAGRAPSAAAVVALAPITDLARAIESGIGAPSPERFVDGADPAGAVSPITDPATVPQLIVHGTGDDVVPMEFSTRYAAAASAADVTAAYPDVGHFSLLDPEQEGWGRVTDWL